MQGLPFVHPDLLVEAVGFQVWQGGCLGVLVTPWFMNLMLLPGAGDSWATLRVGEKCSYALPSGTYEFVLGEEAGIGRYMSCSLFSPMQAFVDHAAAVATADQVMVALMDPANCDSIRTREQDVVRLWHGEARVGDIEPDAAGVDLNPPLSEPESSATGLRERLDTPVSRRALLRGLLPLGDPE